MRNWAWIAPAVAIVAVALLPALRATAPLVEPQQWTIAQVTAAAVRHVPSRATQPQQKVSLQDVLRQIRDLQQQWGGKPAPGTRWALVAAAAVPVMLIIAGIAALLSWLWLLLGWRKVFLVDAAVGLVAAAYAMLASWWLTHVVQSAAAHVLEKAQSGALGGLLHSLGVKPLPDLAAAISLAPQAGLWALLLAFLAMLIWPSPPPP